VEVKSAKTSERDCLLDDVAHAARSVKPCDENNCLTMVHSVEPTGKGPSRAVWRHFGLADSDSDSPATSRLLYIAARGQEVATALTFILEKPRAIRGLLLLNPSIEDLTRRIICRLHAIRCPGIIVVVPTSDTKKLESSTPNLSQGAFGRMPNMIFRAFDSAQPVYLRNWQDLVEQMPHRYSMKSRQRESS
jgi:hypothetical protein